MEKRKEFNYFDGFVNLSQYSLRCAQLLHNTLGNFTDINLEERVKEIHEIEHGADLEKHKMIDRLLKEFLPPIEREDIMSLAHKIDNVTDAVEDVLVRIDIYNVQSLRSEISEFTDLIVKCCQAMDTALNEFRHFKKSQVLHSKIVEMNRLEEDGDVLYQNSVKNLYKTSKDPVELLVWTEIISRLEKCCDAVEDVADDIETIMMKNT